MPEALSTHPEPYTRHWPKPDDGVGWSYPPKDYDKWAELVRQWVLHSVERYGKAEVASWYWELWNEPDICTGAARPRSTTSSTIHRRRGEARTARQRASADPQPPDPPAPKPPPSSSSSWSIARPSKTPLDFITYHAKGQPRVVDGHVRMGIAKNLTDVQRGYRDRRQVPAVPPAAHRPERIRPRGLRRLFGAHISAERVPQRPDVSGLHGRRDDAR